jgi:hypothetical protein
VSGSPRPPKKCQLSQNSLIAYRRTFLFLAWSCFLLPATLSLVGATLYEQKHAIGIGVQSVIKRLPIIIGPICGGVLIDRFGRDLCDG